MVDHTYPSPLKFKRIHGKIREEKPLIVRNFEAIAAIVFSFITILDIVSDYFFIYQLYNDEEFKVSHPYAKKVLFWLSIIVIFLAGRLYVLIYILHSFNMESSITLQSGIVMVVPGIFTIKTYHSNERIEVKFRGDRNDKFMNGTNKSKAMFIIPPPDCIISKLSTPLGWAIIVFLYYEVLYSLLLSPFWLPSRTIYNIFCRDPQETRGERTYFSLLESIVESLPQTVIGLLYFAIREGEIEKISIFVRISLGFSILSLSKNFIHYIIVRSKMHGLHLRDHHTDEVSHIIHLPRDKNTFLSGSRDRSLRIWELKKPLGRPAKLKTKKVINTTRLVRAVRYLKSNIVVLGNSGGIIEFWDIKFSRLIHVLDSGLTDQLYSIASVAYRKDEDDDYKKYFYNVAAVGESGKETGEKGKIVFFVCIVMTRKKDQKVTVKIENKTSLQSLPCKRCFSCQWIGNKQLAILNGERPEIFILGDDSVRTLGIIHHHYIVENSIQLSFKMICEHKNFSCKGLKMKVFPNEKKIVTSHNDGVRLWNLTSDSNTPSQPVWHHNIPTHNYGLCISEDNRYVAAGDDEGCVRIWYIDPNNQDEEQLITRPALSAQGIIYSMCFSNSYEFKELLCGGSNSIVYVFAQNRDQSSV